MLVSCGVLTLSRRAPSLYTVRHNLTYKDGPHTERIKIFLTAVDPYHRYSNELEISN